MPAVFLKLIAALRRYHGEPKIPPAKGPFELVIWENACYLLADEFRLDAFEALRRHVGLTPEAIRNAPDDVLFQLASLGGMRPDVRVLRWRQIARITLERFGGDLEQILQWPYENACKGLRQYPNMGGPGAEKVLLFCGMTNELPLEWNGVRVLTRVGYGNAGYGNVGYGKVGYGKTMRSYGETCRSVQESLRGEAPPDTLLLQKAYLLLREHGKILCRDKRPLCPACPAVKLCGFGMAASARENK